MNSAKMVTIGESICLQDKLSLISREGSIECTTHPIQSGGYYRSSLVNPYPKANIGIERYLSKRGCHVERPTDATSMQDKVLACCSKYDGVKFRPICPQLFLDKMLVSRGYANELKFPFER